MWPWSGNRLNCCRNDQLKRVSLAGAISAISFPKAGFQVPLRMVGHPEIDLLASAAL
jgi:hypothetical protein